MYVRTSRAAEWSHLLQEAASSLVAFTASSSAILWRHINTSRAPHKICRLLSESGCGLLIVVYCHQCEMVSGWLGRDPRSRLHSCTSGVVPNHSLCERARCTCLPTPSLAIPPCSPKTSELCSRRRPLLNRRGNLSKNPRRYVFSCRTIPWGWGRGGV